jgi:Na+-translocating ferredoxin:NAD+ oxidoreductase RnfD subunit
MTARAFFRTPKGQLLIVFAPIVAAAVWRAGMPSLWELAIAVGVAAAIDAPVLRIHENEWVLPSGAILTGLIIGMILSPHEPWYVVAIASVMGIVSKYIARTASNNVFNPAALALLAAFFAFGAEESWWGALPDLPIVALVLVAAGGLYLAQRLNKLPAVVAFLFVYFGAFTLASFVGDPLGVWEVFRTPDLHAVVFLALFMVSDPPTSPPKANDQVIYGVICAVVTVATYFWGGGAYFLLTGVLAGNVWAAWRRASLKRKREARRAAVAA